MDSIFHTTRLITNDRWITQRLFQSFCNLVNRGYPVTTCRRLMIKFSNTSQMDLLYASRNNYNLKTLRDGMTLRINPYEMYQMSHLQNATATSRWENRMQAMRRKDDYFNPNDFLWIIKYHPGAPNYDIYLDKMMEIWSNDPDLIGTLGIFQRSEFKVRYKRYPNLREILMTFKVHGHEEASRSETNEESDDDEDSDLEPLQPQIVPTDSRNNVINYRIQFNDLITTKRRLFINHAQQLNNDDEKQQLSIDLLSNTAINPMDTNQLITQHYAHFNRHLNCIQTIKSLPQIPPIHQYIHADNYKTGHRDIRSFMTPTSITTIFNTLHQHTHHPSPVTTATINPNPPRNHPRTSKPSRHQIVGCHACNKCVLCCRTKEAHGLRFLVEGDHFICNKTGYRYPIKQDFNCNSTYVIYMLFCSVCGVQSIGSTVNIKSRFSSHKSDILWYKGDGCNMVEHFNIQSDCRNTTNNLTNLRIMIIDGIDPARHGENDQILDGLLNRLEIEWQSRLLTHIRGLNSVAGNDTKDLNNSGWNRRNFRKKKPRFIPQIIRNHQLCINKKHWNRSWKLDQHNYDLNHDYLQTMHCKVILPPRKRKSKRKK
eukprot:258124_1